MPVLLQTRLCFFYLLMVYLTTLSVAESMQHRMVERLVNGEVTGM
jgi:hypothetical protein